MEVLVPISILELGDMGSTAKFCKYIYSTQLLDSS